MDKAAYHTHRHVITQIVTHMETCNISMSHRQRHLTVFAMRGQWVLIAKCWYVWILRFLWVLFGKIKLNSSTECGYIPSGACRFLYPSLNALFLSHLLPEAAIFIHTSAPLWPEAGLGSRFLCLMCIVCLCVWLRVCVPLFVYVCAHASTLSIFNPFYLKIKQEAGD